MLTSDDKLFLVLHSCETPLEAVRLPYYIYLFQQGRVDFQFLYKLSTCGLVSRGLNDYVSELISEDRLEAENGVFRLTDIGQEYYDNIILTAQEWERYNNLIMIFNKLSEDELYFTSLVNMLVFDVRSKKGVKGLINEEESIKSSLKSLSSEYSDENFDSAVWLLRYIKEEVNYEE